MSSSLKIADAVQDKIEKLLIEGDLSGLSTIERIQYHNRLCDALGLNPLTKPFDYIKFQGKVVLYARKDATDQLRKIYSISVDNIKAEYAADLYVVTVSGSTPDGRKDSATGVLHIKGLSGEALANALMKCETKAKRRFTLSICGLGILDETEIEDSVNEDREKTVIEAQKRFEDAPPENPAAPLNEYYTVRLQPSQVEERKRLKEAGFQWGPNEKVWYAPVAQVEDIESLGVEYQVAQK